MPRNLYVQICNLAERYSIYKR